MLWFVSQIMDGPRIPCGRAGQEIEQLSQSGYCNCTTQGGIHCSNSMFTRTLMQAFIITPNLDIYITKHNNTIFSANFSNLSQVDRKKDFHDWLGFQGQGIGRYDLYIALCSILVKMGEPNGSGRRSLNARHKGVSNSKSSAVHAHLSFQVAKPKESVVFLLDGTNYYQIA